MQREETVERGVGDAVVAADPFDETGPDQRDGAEQVDDDLRTPIGHVAPRQHITHERLSHQREIEQHAEDPQQFARLTIGAVQHRAEHVQIDDDEEERRTRRVHVADEPAPLDLAHDVFDRIEGRRLARLVVHREEDAREDHDHEHQHRKGTEEVPEVEVLGREVASQLRFDELVDRQALVDPSSETALLGRRGVGGGGGHQTTPSALASRPITSRVSDSNLCGGTAKFSDAGEPLNTRPARSKREPWQGQKNPPGQSAPRVGSPWAKYCFGRHPRCVQAA